MQLHPITLDNHTEPVSVYTAVQLWFDQVGARILLYNREGLVEELLLTRESRGGENLHFKAVTFNIRKADTEIVGSAVCQVGNADPVEVVKLLLTETLTKLLLGGFTLKLVDFDGYRNELGTLK